MVFLYLLENYDLSPSCLHLRFWCVPSYVFEHFLSPQKHIELGSVNLEAGSTQWFDLEPEGRFDS